MSRPSTWIAVALTAVGLFLVLPRIAHHARSEQVFEGPVRTLADAPAGGRLELGDATLADGQSVVFEACAGDGLDPRAWRDAATFEVWSVADGERIVASPADEARLAAARRAGGVGCLEIASAASLGVAGAYAITVDVSEGARAALATVPIRGRIVASRPMETSDLAALAALVLASIAWAVVLARGPATKSALEEELARDGGGHDAPSAPRVRGELRAAAAWIVLGGALFGVGHVRGAGPFAAVVGAGILAAVQLVAAFGLSSAGDAGGRRGVLGLGLGTRRSRVLAALAPLVGLALVVAGRYAAAVVPSTSTSPVEAFVASRSGYLAVASSGILLPLVEELFFRGLLYGLLERAWGAAAAFAAVVIAVPLLHLPQVVGAWGALLSLAITGAALTFLRRASGSVVPSAIAHLAHNTAIALLGFPLG